MCSLFCNSAKGATLRAPDVCNCVGGAGVCDVSVRVWDMRIEGLECKAKG
jgi:hypothetical protein